MIGVAALLGLLLMALAHMPGGFYLLAALLILGFVAEFIAPFFRGAR